MRETTLDTDMLSEVLKGRDRVVVENANAYLAQYERLMTTTITVAEVIKGLHKKKRAEEIASFNTNADSMGILPLDRKAAEIAGQIYAELELAGAPIGRADPLIAGIALSKNYTLATGNTKHFQRIVDAGFPLEIVNWREA